MDLYFIFVKANKRTEALNEKRRGGTQGKQINRKYELFKLLFFIATGIRFYQSKSKCLLNRLNKFKKISQIVEGFFNLYDLYF